MVGRQRPQMMLWTALHPTGSLGFRFELEESHGSAPLPSFDTPSATARVDRGSCSYWRGERRRSWPSPWLTRTPG